MPFKGGGISTDAKEIKKSAARRGQAALLLKLALDAPQSKKVVERTSERRTDARERAGLLASCWGDQTQQDVRKPDTLPRLKPVGFGAMRAATLARVKGSTPPKRSEIHDGLCLNTTIRSIPCTRADVTGSVCIPMDHCATAGTGIDPSSWCILSLTLTITACAGRIVLWNIASLHAIFR